MTSNLRALRPVWPILLGAGVMLTISMGLRQSMGLFLLPLTHDIHISVAQFTIAIAVQNLAWGFLQPVTGALTVRWGFRPILLAGSALYIAGLLVLGTAQGETAVVIGAGVLIGGSLACTGSAIAMSVASRAVSAQLRSLVLGIVSAAGSLGSLVVAPLGQGLSAHFGWRVAVLAFAVLACGMVVAALAAGRVDRIPAQRVSAAEGASAGPVLARAVRHGPFMVMTAAYFVCGMQLVFLTTHLPSYLAICGLDPMLSAEALGVIGGFNILGSLFFGWAGGRWSKLALLGGIYITRSLAIGCYFALPATPGSTLAFAAVLGFLWLGVGPLVAGAVAEMFGLRWQAMLQGVAFVSHQFGSFLGAFGGGLVYDMLGSYTLAWQVGVGLGLTAGLVQVTVALLPPGPPSALAAA